MDYDLKPLGKTCSQTGKPLQPGSLCHSVVVERNGQLLRLDFSSEGWQGPPEGALGHWTTRVPKPRHEDAQRIDPDVLMRYFEQLQEDAAPRQDGAKYVAALLLLKQRRLRLDDVRQTDDGEFLVVSGLRGEGTFEVRNLQLPDAETQQLQQELRAQFAMEWT